MISTLLSLLSSALAGCVLAGRLSSHLFFIAMFGSTKLVKKMHS